jgi:hypothetical protein
MLRSQPVCKGCGQPIWGSYFTALGGTWHPEHFGCAACGRPITDASFNLHQGAPYHAECYANQLAPRCAYCAKPLPGEYLVDSWGTLFCKQHNPDPVYGGGFQGVRARVDALGFGRFLGILRTTKGLP